MNRFVAATAFALIFAAIARPQEQREYLSELRVEAFTSSGERISKIYATVEPLSGHEKYKGEGRGVLLSIPVGNYTLTVQSPGFRTTQQLLTVYAPSVLRTVLLPVAPLHGQTFPTLSGQIAGFRGDPMRPRIRLVPMFGADVKEVHPDEAGRFSFRFDPGPYVLMTVIDSESGPTVADWRQLTLIGTRDVTIDLSGYVDPVPQQGSPKR